MTILSLDTAFYDSEGEEGLSLAAGDQDNPEQVLQKKQMRNQLIEAVQGLPEKEQIVLSLYYTQGLKAKEIAQVLAISIPRVSQLHHRALERLRHILK